MAGTKGHLKSKECKAIEKLLRARMDFYIKWSNSQKHVIGDFRSNSYYSGLLRASNGQVDFDEIKTVIEGYQAMFEATKDKHIFKLKDTDSNRYFDTSPKILIGWHSFKLLDTYFMVPYTFTLYGKTFTISHVQVHPSELYVNERNSEIAPVAEIETLFALYYKEILDLRRNKDLKAWYEANPEYQWRI